MPTVADFDKALHREIGAFRYDPLCFVMFTFPWGISHTPLANEWPRSPGKGDVLEKIGKSLLDRYCGEAEKDAVPVAIASGHGVGADGGGLTLPAFRPYESRQQKWL